MDKAEELIEFLNNLDIKLFDIVQKIEDLKKINIPNPKDLNSYLNSYIKNPKNLYSNFAINKSKDSLIDGLYEITRAINNSKLVEKMTSYQLLLAGAIKVIKLDIEEEEVEKQ